MADPIQFDAVKAKEMTAMLGHIVDGAVETLFNYKPDDSVSAEMLCALLSVGASLIMSVAKVTRNTPAELLQSWLDQELEELDTGNRS